MTTTPEPAAVLDEDPGEAMSNVSPIIVCGPPAKCTCPAVAWWCVCGAWPAGVELVAELQRRDADRLAGQEEA